MTISSIHINKDRVFKLRADNVLYLLLFLLPFIWIQSKTVQMAIELVVLILMLVIEKKSNINRMTLPVLFYVAAHIVSILYNIFISKDVIDNTRIIAAFNTVVVWILGCLVFSVVVRIELNYRRIITLMTFLYWVVLFECLLAVIVFRLGKQIHINGRALYFLDWFNGADRARSFCWMEYASLIPFLLFCLLPYVYTGISRKKPVIRILVMTLSLLPLYLCNSRLGMALVLALVGYMSISEMWKHKVLKVAFIALCFIALFYVITKMDVVIDRVSSLLGKLLFGRESSNITRTMLYSLTWEKIKDTSLLLGAGIKHITVIPDIPLGSHSTYLGAIYKAGILGAVFLFCFFGIITKKTFIMVRKKNLHVIYLVSLLGFFALMIMEDLDGANWMHFVFFIHLGIMIKMGKEKERSGYACIDHNTAVFSSWRCNEQCGA